MFSTISCSTTFFPDGAKIIRQTVQKKMANGVVFIYHRRNLPRSKLRVMFRGGSSHQMATEKGLELLALRMAMQAGGQYSETMVKRLSQTLEAMQQCTVDLDFSSCLITGKSALFIDALHLLSHLLIFPTFPQGLLAGVKNQLISGWQHDLITPERRIATLSSQAFFGEHPYVRNPKILIENVMRVRRRDLIRFYNRLLVPHKIVLIYSGNQPFKDVYRVLKQSFGRLRKKKRQSRMMQLPQISNNFHGLKKFVLPLKQGTRIRARFFTPRPGKGGYYESLFLMQAVRDCLAQQQSSTSVDYGAGSRRELAALSAPLLGSQAFVGMYRLNFATIDVHAMTSYSGRVKLRHCIRLLQEKPLPENMRLATIKALRTRRHNIVATGDITIDLGAWLIAGGRLSSYYHTVHRISQISNEALQEAALSTLDRMHISVFERNVR